MKYHGYQRGIYQDLKVNWDNIMRPIFDQTTFYHYRIYGMDGFVGCFRTKTVPKKLNGEVNFDSIPDDWEKLENAKN